MIHTIVNFYLLFIV